MGCRVIPHRLRRTRRTNPCGRTTNDLALGLGRHAYRSVDAQRAGEAADLLRFGAEDAALVMDAAGAPMRPGG